MSRLEKISLIAFKPILALFIAILLMLQFLSFPGQFAHMASTNSSDAQWRWPLTIIIGMLILCLELIAIAIWKLLNLIKNNSLFSPSSKMWFDLIVRALLTAWLILLGFFLTITLIADDPGLPVMLFFLLLLVTVAVLVSVIIRFVISSKSVE